MKPIIGIVRGIDALARRIWGEAIEPIQMIVVNRRLRAAPIDDADIQALSKEDLTKFVESEGVRSKELDDKLQKMTAALSVAVTVGGLVGQSILQNLAQSGLKVAVAILFLLATLLLLFGVFIGFDGLRPRPRYGYGASYLRSVAKGDADANSAMVEAAVGFQRENAIRANQASAAATSVRNGIILFVAAVLIGMFSAADSPPITPTLPAAQPASTPTAVPASPPETIPTARSPTEPVAVPASNIQSTDRGNVVNSQLADQRPDDGGEKDGARPGGRQ